MDGENVLVVYPVHVPVVYPVCRPVREAMNLVVKKFRQKNFSTALFTSCFLLLFGVVLAAPQDPPDILFTRLLEREARAELHGVVEETRVFPPRQHTEQILEKLPALPASVPRLIARNFKSKLELGPVIAGRPTWNFVFLPKNTDASTFHFFVDQTWGLRLGFEELDSSGVVTHKAIFKRVDAEPQSLAKKRYPRYWLQSELQKVVLRVFGAAALPDGFVTVGIFQRSNNPKNERVELLLSNGLSMVMLTFSKQKVRESEKLVVVAKTQGFVWVLGNLPRAALQTLANGVPEDFDPSSLLTFLRQSNTSK